MLKIKSLKSRTFSGEINLESNIELNKPIVKNFEPAKVVTNT